MKHSTLPLAIGLFVVLVCAPDTATAGTEAAAEPEPGPAFELAGDVGLVSAYVWRGYNLLQDSKQMDQNLMLAPSLTLALPVKGLSVGYWGAYQLNGDNRSALVDAGVGAEQDLIVGYELPLRGPLAGSLGLVYYFFPLADEAIAGTSVPSYLEPSASVTYSAIADFGLAVSYFHGVQDAIEASRHVYINPSVARGFALEDKVGIEAKLGFGYKIFNQSGIENNVYDVLLGVAVPVAATGSLTVTPSLCAAWTNLSGRGFGDEYVVWGGINVGFPVF